MKRSIDIRRFTFYVWVGIAYLLLWVFSNAINYPATFGVRAINEIWRAAYIIWVNYLFFEHALPLTKLSLEGMLRSFLILCAFVILYSFGLYAWRFIGIQLQVYSALRTFPSAWAGVFYNLPYSILSLLFFRVIKHVYDYKRLKIAAQQLRIEKQQAELNYLKSQTNPHFLFNTLNNIYSLARDKSDLAPESILRLSQILRFMLYETGGAFIAVEQELKIISDYIALEQLRYDDSLRVHFNYDIEDMRQALPPLLLIPLVENAFKHGVSETRAEPFVDIHLSIYQQQLAFFVKNSAEALSGEGAVKENIGLSNLRRQLELLYTDYHLSLEQNGSQFTASLKINLSSHA